jgi:Tfp pilus assembly protein PilF
MSNDPQELAVEYLRQAYEFQMKGEYTQALELYTRSIDAFPTAEAYTFRGWTYSFMGKLEEAIRECLQAIQVDPDFGNPYNDIGAYLIEQGKWDEAIAWLEKATRATRYEAYSFPWFNLGRVYEHKCRWEKAKQCYRKSFALDPHYTPGKSAARKLQAKWN